MQNMPSFAYSLSQVEDGWRWRVYDVDGVTVAGGADASRAAAQAAVELALRRSSQVEEPRSFALEGSRNPASPHSPAEESPSASIRPSPSVTVKAERFRDLVDFRFSGGTANRGREFSGRS
ncbi:MAG: hypothetical protein JWQ97_1100 [Phenylobacterium sp.]|nr:hypothetical protein [Phenylobacterium sp.]